VSRQRVRRRLYGRLAQTAKKPHLGSVGDSTNPRRHIQVARYGALLEMADGWSEIYNLASRFSLYGPEKVRAVKAMAAELDASGGEHVGEGFFRKDLLETLEAKNIVRNRDGSIGFTPEFLVDANLDDSLQNYWALQALVADAKAGK